MSSAPITFNFTTFSGMFPEFLAVGNDLAGGYFLRASLIFWNNPSNPANADGNMEMLLYLLTAHIAWLSAPRDAAGNPDSSGQLAPSLVGRISSASEGSVSVSSEWKGSGSPGEEWYLQTKYGAEFWAATAQYRTARYAARPTVIASAIFPWR
jgi:hypothetical protein